MFSCSTTRRTGRPSRDEADRISTTVIETAARLFAERGYAATSIAAIASEARVGKHTIYRRYPDKSDLFRAVVHRLADQVLAGDVADQPAELSHLDQLHALVHRAAHAAVSPQMLAMYRMSVAEGQHFPELAAIALRVEDDRFIGHLAELIAGAQAAGDLAPGDPAFIARFLVAGVTGYLFEYCLAGHDVPPEDVETHVERSWRLFLHGAAEKAPAHAAFASG